MAKKVWIENWYPRDEHVFNAFATCGALQKEDLNEYVKDKRIRDYERDGYIEKDTDLKTGDEYYKLTDKGRDLCRDKYDREPVSFHSWNHESGVRDLYFQISDKNERMQQMSEPELQREIARDIEYRKQSDDEYERERGYKMEREYQSGKISCPDFGILKINEETREVEQAQFYESITTNYKDSEIQAKFDMASTYSGSLTTAYV